MDIKSELLAFSLAVILITSSFSLGAAGPNISPGSEEHLSIVIERPEGGENWTAGTEEEISWSSEEGEGNITGVDLEYSDDGGENWTYIEENIEDTGNYTWSVPETETEEAVIRATIYDDNDTVEQDVSGLFTVMIPDPGPPEDLSVDHYGEGGDHNRVSWDASPDEVSHYNVYRSEYEEGPYGSIATVDADGSTDHEYVDEGRGTADDTLWWYMVSAEDEDGRESEGAGPVREPAVDEYTLTMNIEGEGSTDPVEGTHHYEDGTEVEIEAIEDVDGWYFVEWTGDHQGTDNESSIIIDENKSITAHFEEEQEYVLTVNSTEGGMVVDPGEGQFIYAEGETVELEAVADEDHHFVEWTGDTETIDDPKANQTFITMENDHEITAGFERIEVEEVEIEPEEDLKIEAGETLNFSAYAYDQNDDLITDDVTEFDWKNISEIKEEENVAVFHREDTGEYEVTATYNGVTSSETTVTVYASDPDYIEIFPKNAAVEAGEAIEYSAIAYDRFGNRVENVTEETDWVIDEEAGGEWDDNEYRSEVAGEWTVQGIFVYEDEEMTDEASLTVEPGDIEYIEISPSDSTITAGENETYYATAYDEHGNGFDVTDETSWHIDEEAGGGWDDNTYTSEHAGHWTVTGTHEEEAEATLSVEPNDVHQVIIEPGEALTIEAGETVDFSAYAYDQFGNLIEDDDEEFVWQNTDETGLFDETETGEYEVTATYDTVTSPITTVTVETAEVDYVEIEPEEDQTITAGDTINFAAAAYDRYDNIVEDDDEEFVWQNTDSTGLFDKTETGEYEVTATYDTVTSPIILVKVEPDDIKNVEIYPSQDQVVEAGTELGFNAHAYDRYGNLITDDVTDFDWTNIHEKDENTAIFYKEDTGEYHVSAGYEGVYSKPTAVTVIPAETDSVEIDPEQDRTVSAGAELEFTSFAYDQYGNLITDDVTDFDWTDINELDQEDNVAIFYEKTAGEYQVSASYDGITSEQTTVTVEPTDIEEVIIEPKTDQTITAGDTINFAAAAYDQEGNLIEDDDSAFTWENTDGTGLFDKTEAGTYVIVASLEGIKSEPTNVTVTPAETHDVIIDPEESQTITAGTTVDFSAAAYDQYGNLIEDDDAEFTWQNTDGTGLFDNTETGEYDVMAKYDEVDSPVTVVTVEPAEINDVIIEPEESQTITAGTTVDFSAAAYDQYGNLIEDDDAEFTWQNTDDTGLFEKTEAGTYEITATYDGSTSTPTEVVVEAAEIDHIKIEPDGVTVFAGEEIAFSARAYDRFDNEIRVLTSDTRWSIEEGAGGGWDQDSGIYTSQYAGRWEVTGSYTHEEQEFIDRALLIVEEAEPVRIEISPQTYSLEAGDHVEYNATAYDDAGNPYDVTYHIEWSIEEGAGGSWSDHRYVSEYAGEWNVSATYHHGGVEMTDDAVLTVTPSEISTVVISPGNSIIEAGETLEFTAEARDLHGNLIEENDEEFTWQNTDDTGSFRETTAGIYRVTAAYDGIESEPIDVEVEPAEVERVDLYPEMDLSISAGEELSISSEARDRYGNVITDDVNDFTWENATGGSFYRENTGEYDITASYGNVASDSITITVGPAAVDSIMIAEHEDDIVTGESVDFTVIAYDRYGNEIGDHTEEAKLWIEREAGGTWDQDTGTYSSEEPGTWVVRATYTVRGSILSTETTLTVEPGEYVLMIEITGGGTTEPSEGNHTYEYGEQITLKAISGEGWSFSRWKGDHESEDEEVTITIRGDIRVEVVFEERAHFQVDITSHLSGDEINDDSVTVRYTVKNTGTEYGSRRVFLRVKDSEGNNVSVFERIISLEPGQEFHGEFTWQAEKEGDYHLNIDCYDTEDQVEVRVMDIEDEGRVLPLFWVLITIIAAVSVIMMYWWKFLKGDEIKAEE